MFHIFSLIYLLTLASSDHSAGVWIWQFYDEDEDTTADMEIPRNEQIRIRVEGETFIDTTASQVVGGKDTKIPPYSITVR
jgi:hypothetical protein